MNTNASHRDLQLETYEYQQHAAIKTTVLQA